MRILRYDEIEIYPYASRFASRIKDFVTPSLDAKYGHSEYHGTLHPQLTYVLSALCLLKDSNQITVLDIGCGNSSYGRDPNDPPIFQRMFEPWLCRALSEYSVRVVGVDYHDMDGEKFEHHERNLWHPCALESIHDGSIDLVNMHSVFGSPGVHRPRELATALMPQIERVLKPEGVFIYMDWDKDFRIQQNL